MRTGTVGKHQSVFVKAFQHSGKVKYLDTSHLASCVISPGGVSYDIRLGQLFVLCHHSWSLAWGLRNAK